MKYQFNVDEMVEVTLCFLESRPFLKWMIIFMKMACLLMLFSFTIKLLSRSISVYDGMVGLFALSWLLYRRQVNAFFLKKRLNQQKINEGSLTIHVLKHKIAWRGNFMSQGEQRFKIMRFVYQIQNKKTEKGQTQNGFIIPLMGLAQSAKFIWLPTRAFKTEQDQTDFLSILEKNNITMKAI